MNESRTITQHRTRQTQPEPIRFWSKVHKAEANECWYWTGRLDKDGYGYLQMAGKTIQAHRYSYLLNRGGLPEGLLIRHTCDNPRCVNPTHLLIGTHTDNMQDMVTRGRSTIGSRNPKAKLTETQVHEIRQHYSTNHARGEQNRLAIKYGVAASTIKQILAGNIWKHLPCPPKPKVDPKPVFNPNNLREGQLRYRRYKATYEAYRKRYKKEMET